MSNNEMMRNFFNQKALIWDSIYYHDEKKMQKILNICKIKQGEKVLDVACGTGVLTKKLVKTQAKQITAIDLSEKMIEIAKIKLVDNKVTFITTDLFDFCGDNFDCIILYSAYPHFLNKKKLAEKFYALLKPKGRFIVAHSESKESLNSYHHKNALHISLNLKSVQKEFEYFKSYFNKDITIDSDEIYLFSGVKAN